jgi:protein-disulfide isomerase
MPLAVPVTVALVLGLAVGLVLGWVIPRPGGGSSAVAGAAAPDTDGQAGGQPEDGTGAQSAGTQDTAQPPAAEALDPVAPQAVPGGPDGTEEVAGLVLGTQGPLVEVFEDYVCPFCARLELAVGSSLRESAQAGEIRLVLHPIAFLTEDSPRAANASACVYQHEDTDTWAAFHELLYQRQDPAETVGQFATPVLLELATEAGATSDAVAPCIEDGTYQPWVAAITQQAFARGVSGTPTVTVDGTRTDPAELVQ